MVKTRNQGTDEHNYGNFNIKCLLSWELQCDQGGKWWQNLTFPLWHQEQMGQSVPGPSSATGTEGRCSMGGTVMDTGDSMGCWGADQQLFMMLMHEVTWNVMKTTHWSHCLYKDHLYWGHQKWREDQGIRISTSQWSQLEGQGAACQQSLLYDQGIWLPADQVMHLRVWEPEHQKIS